MSEKLLKILLSELSTVRVTCKRCSRGVLEVSLDRLNDVLVQGQCRFCHHAFFPPRTPDLLENLKKDLEELHRLTDLEITFVLPNKD